MSMCSGGSGVAGVSDRSNQRKEGLSLFLPGKASSILVLPKLLSATTSKKDPCLDKRTRQERMKLESLG